MTLDPGKIARQVSALVEPALEDLGFELVDVEYLSRHGKWVLQLIIDSEEGVTIDDCAFVSREIGDLIDVKDIIEHEYVLEVSSPGLDRPLTKMAHFAKVVGSRVKVRTIAALEGRRNFTGRLMRAENGGIALQIDSGEIFLPLDQIKKANLIYEFEQVER
ncbi:MAG: ribosome maturation factor RimP [Desulfobacteraceae bacterium]